MFNFVRLSDGGIRRIAAARPESAVIGEIAARALKGHPIDFRAFARHRRIREAIAAIVPGMEALADIDAAKQEFHIAGRLMHEPKFATPSGRARFKTHETPRRSAAAPFMLTTTRSEGQFNSIVYEEQDAYRRTDTRWAVLMNPDDIAALGLAPGAACDIRSAQGEMRGVRVFAFGLNRGDAMAYYPEANVLTSADVDPRSKTPGFKATPVWIEKAAG
jgi:anaerobic selenocysteine-containing dehydrogenase